MVSDYLILDQMSIIPSEVKRYRKLPQTGVSLQFDTIMIILKDIIY